MQGSPLHASSGRGRGWCYVHPKWTALRPAVEADGKNAHSLGYSLLLECWRSPAVDERGSTGSVNPCHGQFMSEAHYIPRLWSVLRGWHALQPVLSSSMPWTSSVVNSDERKVANIRKASITEGCQSRGDANARCSAHGLLQRRYDIASPALVWGQEWREVIVCLEGS
jgi:hypothetical protein